MNDAVAVSDAPDSFKDRFKELAARNMPNELDGTPFRDVFTLQEKLNNALAH